MLNVIILSKWSQKKITKYD